MQRTPQRHRLPRTRHARRDQRLYDTQMARLGRGRLGGEVDAQREVAEGAAEQLGEDGGVGGEVVLGDGVPQLGRVVFGQGHDGLGGAVAEEVGLFDGVDEGVVEDAAGGVEFHEVRVGPVGEVDEELPGSGPRARVVAFVGCGVFGGGG